MSHIPYFNQPETESKRMNKNGYEIRAQLVELAKDYLEKQHAANLEYTAKLVELGQLQHESYLEAMKPYSLETVIQNASKMYEFVSSKK
jgi:hypothetical protein